LSHTSRSHIRIVSQVALQFQSIRSCAPQELREATRFHGDARQNWFLLNFSATAATIDACWSCSSSSSVGWRWHAGGHRELVLENLALRQQLTTLRRTTKRAHLRTHDRLFWIVWVR
jgi:hypothetical protein